MPSEPLPYRPASEMALSLRELPGFAWLDSSLQAYRGCQDLLTALPYASERAPAGGGVAGWLRALAGTAGGEPPLVVAALAYPDLPARQPVCHRAACHDWWVVIDHAAHTCRLHYTHAAAAGGRLDEIRHRLRQDPPPRPGHFALLSRFRPDQSADSYRAAFSRIHEYLLAGDVYQVNLAQRFSAPYAGDPFAAYLTLRAASPAPFSAFLDHGDQAVLCASPECLLDIEGNIACTYPIKGTRPRRADPAADRQEVDRLLASAKDRAENLMIVDLLRNDLGKVCRPGSIGVPMLFGLESYARVHHLVSTVRGELAADADPLDALEACFPGGSITGAPKRRAMEIIEELEAFPREYYCGSILALHGDRLLANISIRTLVARQDTLYCWGGGGIVADSDCANEYQETFDKAGPLMGAIEGSHLRV